MKVLLIGGLGFIGKRFIRKFSDEYELVICAMNEDVLKTKKDFPVKNFIIEECNVEEKKIYDVIIKHKPNVVIHLAALTGLKKCHNNPEKAFKINVFGTFNVINACVKSGTRLIFISSREVYGETLSDESKEDDPLNPNNTYGITKMLGEILIKQSSLGHDLDYTILRLTNVYGPEGDQYGAQIIIKKALIEKKVQILGGKQQLNYIFVDDVVDLINLILNVKRASKEIFNVGSKDTLTIKEFVDEVFKSLGIKSNIEFLPMRETETINFKPSLKKLELLGFSAKTSIREGIGKTIKWYSDNVT